VFSSNSGGSNKLPDDGRLLPKHVEINKGRYNKCILLVFLLIPDFNIILPLNLGLLDDLSPSDLPTTILYASLLSPTFYMPCPSHYS
jgi:hypothetical protein